MRSVFPFVFGIGILYASGKFYVAFTHFSNTPVSSFMSLDSS